MLHLSKKIEYALIALRHIASQSGGMIVTTKELSEQYSIPYDLLAKVLQKLTRSGIIISFQGVKGGYVLGRNAEKIKLSDVILSIEGKQNVNLIDCKIADPDMCSLYSKCTIKDPLSKIQNIINNVFDEMTISEIV